MLSDAFAFDDHRGLAPDLPRPGASRNDDQVPAGEVVTVADGHRGQMAVDAIVADEPPGLRP